MKTLFTCSLLILSLSFGAFNLSSEIFECQTLDEVEKYIEADTWVIAEIDDIFLTGTTVASRVSFFDILKDDLLKEGYEPEQITNKLYSLWFRAQQYAQLEISGSDVSRFIEFLNNENIPLFGLTFRGPRLAYRTLDHLHANQLYFPLDQKYHKNHTFEDNLVLYFEGTLFLHPLCSKGEYLLKLFSHLQETPKKIVCLDHQLINLVQIQHILEDKGIEFVGIYLNRPKEPLTKWDEQVGKLQLEYMGRILPNDFAEYIVHHQGLISGI
ncbi:MAG: hypothetical protein S4CHLAM7_08110 [Chlamydiae bacterium]|nr:hypothetical protein [Chlamydiota bacterium]